MPSVEILGVQNGHTFDPGSSLGVEVVALGPDNLAGTEDDGKIKEIRVLLNGKEIGSYSEYRETNSYNLEDGFLSYNFEIPADTPAGEYRLEVIAEGLSSLLTSRDEKFIRVSGANRNDLIINSPALGTVLDQGESYTFVHSGAEVGDKTYLEVNGRIQWAGTLNIDESLSDDTNITDDGITFSISDGTGREPIIFEFDVDGVSNAAGSTETFNVLGREIEVTGSYVGVEDREYLLEMDSNNSFRWSLDGGATFNDKEIPLIASISDPNFSEAHSLSGGISVSLPMNSKLFDQWVIKAIPQNEIVAVASTGSRSEKISQTKVNIIRAINRARNQGIISLYAEDPNSRGVYEGSLPEEYIGQNTIILIHDGSYPIIEEVSFNFEELDSANRSFTLLTEVCMDLISGTSADLELKLDGCLELNHALLDLRLVNVDSLGHRSYSRPYNYLVSDPAALKAQLNKVGDIYEPGRYATFSIDALSDEGGIEKLKLLDLGNMYDQEEVNSLPVSISSLSGRGAEIDLNVSNGNVTGENVLAQGEDYTANDIVTTSPPTVFDFGRPITLDAQVLGSQSQLERVAFYANGVELMEPVQVIPGGYYRTTFAPKDPGDYFISVRPLYGDSRDSGPRAVMALSGFSRNSPQQNFTTIFGWQASWRHQHGREGTLEFPSWYWEGRNNYWDTDLAWRIRPDWSGAAPIRVLDPADSTGEITVELLDSSMAIKQEVLLDQQLTELEARMTRQTLNSPKVVKAYLYGNDLKILEIDVADNNDTEFDITFDWQVAYARHADLNGTVEYQVFVEDANGARYYDQSPTHTIQILNQTGTLPEIQLISPTVDGVIPLGSSIRLSSTAVEEQGVFEGVQYYINNQLQYVWSGVLDLNGEVPEDGSILEIRDGITDEVVIFEFDNDQIVSSGGEHQVIAGQLRNQDKLIVSGPFTGSSTTIYYIEIDGDRTVRWSKDGGLTFVNEKVSIDNNLSLGNGLAVDFGNFDQITYQDGTLDLNGSLNFYRVGG